MSAPGPAPRQASPDGPKRWFVNVDRQVRGDGPADVIELPFGEDRYHALRWR